MMTRRRLASYLSLGLCGTLAVLSAAPAQPVKLPPDPSQPIRRAKPPVEIPETEMVLPAGTREVTQGFPSTGKAVTSWKVWYTSMRGNGLVIKGAWFKRGPSDRWLQVLGDARLAQAFVPYHNNHHRFWDVDYGFGLDPLTKADVGANGDLLRVKDTDRFPTVGKEIRDRGIMYKHPAAVRRGETMLLWGSLSAANYRYLIEYGFQDDGTITFRCGASGHNYAGDQWTPHMHNAMWRVDVNLGGPDHNSVLLCEHVETQEGAPFAQTRTTPIKEACGIDWDPYKFTMLRVINTQRKNKRGQPISYDLMPSRQGNSRHYGPGMMTVKGKKMRQEECTMHDFWVTRARPGQMQYKLVPEYVADHDAIEDTDVVLWYNSVGHHEPRSEDGEDIGSGFQGATHVMWSGFDLRPRNVFDRSPFYGQ
jgi:Cu2+-containing amine oxidase